LLAGKVGLDFRIDFGAQTETDMKRSACLLSLLMIAAFCSPTMAATSPAPRTTTVGGGLKRPWTPPYLLAMAAVPDPTMLAALGMGAAALVIPRRK